MLCSVCNKNVAIIFVNKIDKEDPTKSPEQVALCMDCAKKQGIDPLKTMFEQMKSISPEEMQNMQSQFDSMIDMADPDFLDNILGGGLGVDDEEYDADETEASAVDNDGNTKVKTKTKKKKNKHKFLDQFGTNITQKARQNELDAVIGREAELARVIQILNRRKKNNPALIGEPGVGKSAIAYALAIAIVNKKVPQKLQNKEVYLIDMASILAGTQFRGQFESRMKNLVAECVANKNIILVLDELHTIVGGSDKDNSLNAANILKPALANGDIQLVGTTTLTEYRKYIEKDPALERRFQQVIVEEPSLEDSVRIIKGIKKYYEDYHNVEIKDETVVDAVRLSDKYVHDRFLPDKAIDLIDEACSNLNLKNVTLSEIEKLEQELANVIHERESILEDDNVESYEKAAVLKTEECALSEKLESLKNNLKKPVLSKDDLATVITLWTKIPVSRIKTKESEKILNLNKNLKAKIIGQDKALESVSMAILRKRANLKNINRPPSFLFVGPTGVGKTELVKRLAEELFDRKDAIIKLDMSEYMESHSVSKLIGSPPGYVGYEEAGQLTEKIRRNPYSILLFDEVEKAHPTVFNLLLQMLDEGLLTDSTGRTVSFKHTVIILTSNLGTNFKNDGYGFSSRGTEQEVLENKINTELKNFFAPEFLNRLDDIIIFNKLNHDNMLQIVNIMLSEFSEDIKEKNITLNFTDSLKEFIVEKGFDPKYGARPLRRAIEKNIEDLLAIKYITNEISDNNSYTIDYDGKEVVIK